MASDAGGDEKARKCWGSAKEERFCEMCGSEIEGRGRRREGGDEGEAALGRN